MLRLHSWIIMILLLMFAGSAFVSAQSETGIISLESEQSWAFCSAEKVISFEYIVFETNKTPTDTYGEKFTTLPLSDGGDADGFIAAIMTDGNLTLYKNADIATVPVLVPYSCITPVRECGPHTADGEIGANIWCIMVNNPMSDSVIFNATVTFGDGYPPSDEPPYEPPV